MAYVKIIKNKAYFKRYQVKYRRRREGKTDYQARRRLVTQDKNKYNAPKHRFVVRITNKKIIVSLIYSTIVGDKVLSSADSTELTRYGIPSVGLTNFSAAYCVGLLVARRHLKKLKLDEQFSGLDEVTGEEYHVEEGVDDKRPFKAFLDVGIARTTTGHRIFAAMKGAVDGGLNIPHSVKRFAGYKKEEGAKEGSLDSEFLRDRILGKHIADYITYLQENDSERYTRQFSKYIAAGIKAEGIVDMYKTAHQKIRANPERPEKQKRKHDPVHIRERGIIKTSKGKYYRPKKLTKDEKVKRVQLKMALVSKKMAEES